MAPTPIKAAATGIGKRCRKGFRKAARKQQIGIVTAPTISEIEAMVNLAPCTASKGVVAAKVRFRKPNPKNEI